MSKDYYKILGVDKNASKDDIKKAFRKLAHEHHPDKKSGNEAKFKEASEAYSVLGDDEKRKQYDTFGSSGPGGQGWQDFSRQAGAGGFGGFDFSGFTQGGFSGANGQGFEFDLGDIFGDFFGGGRSSGNKSGIRRGSDIQIDIQISFSESVFGVEKEVTLTKDSTCDTCKGTGAKPNTGMKDCDICKGKGKITETRRSIFGNMQTTRVCDSCHGLGKIPKELCNECRGDGVINKKETIKLKIPAGIENGQTLKYAGKGESIAHGQTGDLYINVHISPHKVFRRDGQNLFMDLDIKLTKALLGGEEKIETLDGSIIVKIPEGITHGEILRVREKGIPGHSGKRGDLMIVVRIIIPKKLSRSLKEKIQEIQREGL